MTLKKIILRFILLVGLTFLFRDYITQFSQKEITGMIILFGFCTFFWELLDDFTEWISKEESQ